MYASRLKISPEVAKYKNLPVHKRTSLRKEKIKQLILSLPAGTPISTTKFQQVTGLNNSAAWRLVDQMVKAGEIIKTQTNDSKKSFSYDVNNAKLKGFIVPAQRETAETQVKQEVKQKVDVEPTLQEKAKVFTWLTGSDSLSQFIAWHDERN